MKKLESLLTTKHQIRLLRSFVADYLLTSPCLGHENLIKMHNVADLLMTVQNSLENEFEELLKKDNHGN